MSHTHNSNNNVAKLALPYHTQFLMDKTIVVTAPDKLVNEGDILEIGAHPPRLYNVISIIERHNARGINYFPTQPIANVVKIEYLQPIPAASQLNK